MWPSLYTKKRHILPADYVYVCFKWFTTTW